MEKDKKDLLYRLSLGEKCINVLRCMFIRLSVVAMLVASFMFTSCELDGPLAVYKIVVNESSIMLPNEILYDVSTIKNEFENKPCEEDYAVSRFRQVCKDLQNYYDNNSGELIWGSFTFDVCLYNLSSYEGGPEGLLVEQEFISYTAKTDDVGL